MAPHYTKTCEYKENFCRHKLVNCSLDWGQMFFSGFFQMWDLQRALRLQRPARRPHPQSPRRRKTPQTRSFCPGVNSGNVPRGRWRSRLLGKFGSFTRTSTNTGPRSAARFKNYLHCSSVGSMKVTRTGCQMFDPSSSQIFFIILHLNEDMNQKVNKNKNNNSSNSLVFGRWLQTKIAEIWMDLSPL